MEVNNCDRCTTLAYGETRAPSSRWDKGNGVLCDPCRLQVLVASLGISYTPDGTFAIEGNREGLRRLQEAIGTALYRPGTVTEVRALPVSQRCTVTFNAGDPTRG